MNLQEIRKTLEIFKSDGLIEIRTVKAPILSGYFNNIDALVKAVENRAEETWYFVLNEIKPQCDAREQFGTVISKPKNTTSDKDIAGRDWILVDADPKRISGVSATDDEKAKAKETIIRIYNYLNEVGFEKPVIADSGNGYHLLYRISAENDNEQNLLIKNFLIVLNMLFSDEYVDIDTSVYNASRITKLYGVVGRKGANKPDRPHRSSKILRVPPEIKKTRLALIQQIADMLPKPEQPLSKAQHIYTNNNLYSSDKFDLRQFLYKNSIQLSKEVSTGHSTKFVLSECVFDSNHKSPDAAIFQMNSGAIAYKCFHASCSGYKWQDVRLKFEPTAYDKKYGETKYIITDKPNPNHKNPEYNPLEMRVEEPPPSTDAEPVFYTTEQIRRMKRPPEEFIKTGILAIDKKMRGLKKGYVTCLSGLRGCGKSSIISQISIEAAEQGYKTALFSGELPEQDTFKWLMLQAAGKDYVYETQYENYYNVFDKALENISKWTDEKIYIYNNHYGNKVSELLSRLNKAVADKKVDLIILDNLMALDISELDRDRYVQQSKFVDMLIKFARHTNTHIIFIAHPRKSQGFLRLDDVSGSNDITNRVDNAFIMHRVNDDFKRLSFQMYKWTPDNILYRCTNVIEVLKDRFGGNQDEFIPLYFEKSSKRLRNNEYENKNYSWVKPKINFVELNTAEDLPFEESGESKR